MKQRLTWIILLLLLNVGAAAQIVTFIGVADNNTDNTQALNNILASGSEVIIPNQGGNYYKIAGTVTVPPNKKLIFIPGGKFNVTGKIIGNVTILKKESQIWSPNSIVQGTWVTDTLKASDFGAVGDGVTNDYLALNNFFNAINTTTSIAQVLEPGKVYYIKDQIIWIVKRDANFIGNGSTIVRSHRDIVAGKVNSLAVTGQYVKIKTVKEDLLQASNILELNDASGIVPGMGVIIRTKQSYAGERLEDRNGKPYYHHHTVGMLNIVQDVIGNTVILRDTTPCFIEKDSIKNDARFYNVYDVKIRKVKFALKELQKGDINATALRVTEQFGLFMEDIEVNPGGYSTSINTVLDATVRKFKIIGWTIAQNGNQSGNGTYGITASLCINTIFDSIYARCITHGIALSGLSTGTGYNITIKNCDLKASATSSNGLDSHASGRTWVYNSTLWGAQWNCGEVDFINCTMNTNYSMCFNEREGSSRAGNTPTNYLVVNFYGCTFNATGTAPGFNYIYRQRTSWLSDERDGSITSRISVYNSTFNTGVVGAYITNGAYSGKATRVYDFIVDSCTFIGTGKVYFPKVDKTGKFAPEGTFYFTNNKYGLMMFPQNPSYDGFTKFIISGNTPVNNLAKWQIDMIGFDNRVQFTNNTLQGILFKYNGSVRDGNGNFTILK